MRSDDRPAVRERTFTEEARRSQIIARAIEVLAEDPEADVDGVVLHPDTLEPQIVTVLKDRTESIVLDPAIEADLKAVRALNPGDPSISGREHANSRWLAAFTGFEIVGPFALLSNAEKHLPSSTSGLLVAAVPIFSALLAWLTAAAVTIAMLTLTGAATVAAALHRSYALGWVCATVAATLLLLLPLPLETRTVLALLCGPLVGIGVHLAALARPGR